MKTSNLKTRTVLALALSGMLAIGPALAEKPSWAGGDKHDKGNSSKHESDGSSSRDGGRRDHFDDSQRVAVRHYYEEHYTGKHCPPGLAKKHNGCMPPGQAKKWQIGHQLPRDVTYYSVPQALVTQIGQPPSGHRYVRVASDILLLAIGTGMVVDAIQNLGRS